jgi:hypothetical protein
LIYLVTIKLLESHRRSPRLNTSNAIAYTKAVKATIVHELRDVGFALDTRPHVTNKIRPNCRHRKTLIQP